MLIVVIGPQTRLANAVLNSSSWESGTTFLLVARHADEYDAVALAHPGAAVYRSWDPESPMPDAEAVAVLCCAFGLIHPGAVAASADLQKTGADYAMLERILRQYSERPVHLVLISSVLALCARPGREYYAGWKHVVEGLVRQLAEEGQRRTVSVLYPGRLVETTAREGTRVFPHTSYRTLAEKAVLAVQDNRSVNAVVGLDARLWLMLRSAGLLWAALTGRR
jgi:NAD(P)-dependent dehydrogenase (short-subunit alcohol dehydrogenase family)